MKLLEWRKKSKMSQKEVALHLNCTKQAISNYENGKTNPSLEMSLSIVRLSSGEVDIHTLVNCRQYTEGSDKIAIAKEWDITEIVTSDDSIESIL